MYNVGLVFSNYSFCAPQNVGIKDSLKYQQKPLHGPDEPQSATAGGVTTAGEWLGWGPSEALLFTVRFVFRL